MPVVETIALAFFIILAIGTLSFVCPSTVPEGFEFVLPYLLEIILVDVSLDKGSVNVWTGRDGAVDEN